MLIHGSENTNQNKNNTTDKNKMLISLVLLRGPVYIIDIGMYINYSMLSGGQILVAIKMHNVYFL